MTCDLLVARQCETRCESLGGYPIKTALHPRREGRTVDFAHHKPKDAGCQVPEPRSCRRRPVANTTAPSTARVRPTKPTAFHAHAPSRPRPTPSSISPQANPLTPMPALRLSIPRQHGARCGWLQASPERFPLARTPFDSGANGDLWI